ncbi:PP2C family protein-serine/threonine phosphatase [Microbispora sp. NPDC049125]|uniref:PP2C family protein-serine/threonine phosphatase n=1 Tax=Microbispora sp. NPDC049125 TaxID=3154929 RepID=UPI003466A9B6
MAAGDVPLIPGGGFEDLYENAPCGYLSTLADGTIVRVNRTLADLIGYRKDQLVGRSRVQSLLPAGDRIFYETHFAPLLALQAGVREIAVELKRADGGRLPVLLNAVMNDEPGRPATVRICVFPATGRREYERELLRARQRAERSEMEARELARTLQRSFIPPALPEVPGLDIAGAFRPAGDGDEIGGDFYDMHETVGGWALTLGDVCGKGVEAAVVTSLARYALRAAPLRQPSPSAILADLNATMLREHTPRFLTAVYTRIGPGETTPFRLTLCLGGHSPAFHVHGDEVRRIGVPGTMLGVLPQVRLTDVDVGLHPGDVVLFCTDGVAEGRQGTEFFGEERLERILAASRADDAASICKRLMDEVVTFQAGLPRDDIAIVVLKVPD